MKLYSDSTYSLKDLPIGSYFKRNETTEKMYIRGEYIRGVDYIGRKLNKYECMDFDDANRLVMLKGSTQVILI